MSNLTLIDVLRDQQQCDPDGIYCIVSRQAVDEAIAALQAQAHDGEVVATVGYRDDFGDLTVKFLREDLPEGTKLFTAPPRVVDDWQPIETAPKDGTRVLLYGFDGYEAMFGVWNKQWVWADYLSNRSQPTHWLPLPKAPALQAALEGK